jgi:hypothetical protein
VTALQGSVAAGGPDQSVLSAYSYQAHLEDAGGKWLGGTGGVVAEDVAGGYRLRGTRRLTDYIYNTDQLFAVLDRCSEHDGNVACIKIGRIGVRVDQYIFGGPSTRWKYTVSTTYIAGPRYQAEFTYQCARNVKRAPDNYCDTYRGDRADGFETAIVAAKPGSYDDAAADLNADFGRAFDAKKYAMIKVIVRWDDFNAAARGDDGQVGFKFRMWDTTRLTADDAHLEKATGSGQ